MVYLILFHPQPAGPVQGEVNSRPPWRQGSEGRGKMVIAFVSFIGPQNYKWLVTKFAGYALICQGLSSIGL